MDASSLLQQAYRTQGYLALPSAETQNHKFSRQDWGVCEYPEGPEKPEGPKGENSLAFKPQGKSFLPRPGNHNGSASDAGARR